MATLSATFLKLCFGLACALAAVSSLALVTRGLQATVQAMRRWWRGPWAWLRQKRQVQTQELSHERQLPVWIGVPVGVGLALLARDVLLSAWVLLAASGLGYWYAGYSQRRQRGKSNETAVRDLVRLLRNYLRGSLAAALQRSAEQLEPGPVKAALEQSVRAHAVGVAWEEALKPLRDLGSQLERLSLLLLAAPTLQEEALLHSLQELEDEMSRMNALRSEAGAEVVLLQLTVRFLAFANVAAVLASLIFPTWRDFYVSTWGRRMTFVAASAMPVAAFIYFAEEIEALRGYL